MRSVFTLGLLIPLCASAGAAAVHRSKPLTAKLRTLLGGFHHESHRESLIDAAIMSSRGHSRARKIWIDDAFCGAARGRRVALWQRRVAAFAIVGPPGIHVQANRISRIVHLGRRRSY